MMRLNRKHFNQYYRIQNGEDGAHLTHTGGPLSCDPVSPWQIGRESVEDLKKKLSR